MLLPGGESRIATATLSGSLANPNDAGPSGHQSLDHTSIMGRPFATELAHVAETLTWAERFDISPVANFFDRADGKPLITIGAGGSFTAAEMARLLFESRGGFGFAHTPLSFLQNCSDLHEASVLIFTAGGSNRDVLAAFQAAVEREPKSIHVVCGSSHSKIEGRIARCPHATFSALPIPTGKDGYLATNSLVAFCAVGIRASRHALPSASAVNRIMSEADPEQWLDAGAPGSSFYPALYGEWARPAAVDLESKFSEAGLGGVLLADYRHFAHGRHNWLDKRGPESTVIAFLTPSSARLARKTLGLFPRAIRVVKLETHTPGPAGGLELIFKVLRYTACVGAMRGIDPGRPGVPPFGRRIYHLGPVICERDHRPCRDQLEPTAVNRKAAARGTLADEADRRSIHRAFAIYVRRLQNADLGALVADFDGTVVRPVSAKGPLDPTVVAFLSALLAHGVPVYFATGRGDSIHAILKHAFQPSSWGRVFVSYYNGALTLPLSESDRFTEAGLPSHPALDHIFRIIQQDELLSRSVTSTHKRCQVALRLSQQASLQSTAALVKDLIAKHAGTTLRVVQSSHSIDIIPIERTKLACVEFAKRHLRSDRSVLTVGDCGAAPGNDFDLLTHPLSLSVDAVSTDLDSCWNLLPPGVSSSAGLAHYGSWMRLLRGRYRIAIPREAPDE
ncbi:MAG: hypothetical protein ABSH34_13835 [Verrucomicrobiota bacterium]